MRAASLVGAIVLTGCLTGCMVDVGPEPIAESERGLTVATFCKHAVFYVGKTSISKYRDGSALRPFLLINDALDAAASYCSVTVRIGTGTWVENINLTKNTTLIGASRTATILLGHITNTTTSPLTVNNMTIDHAGSPGAVYVNNAFATTTIDDVTIKRARYFGIRQVRGTLWVSNSTIQGTLAGSTYVHQGSGIYLAGGATAYLSHTTLSHNIQGLVVVGVGSKARLTNVQVDNSSYNLYFDHLLGASAPRNGFAALEARDGGLIWAKGLDVLDNEIHGLSVHHGARAHVEDCHFTRTRAAGSPAVGGINIAVRWEGATLEMRDCVVEHADLAGVQAVAAYFSLADSYVRDNPIGFNVQYMPADQDIDCARQNVYWDNDTSDIDTDAIYVPSTSNPLAGIDGPQSSTTVEPGLTCPTVPWP